MTIEIFDRLGRTVCSGPLELNDTHMYDALSLERSITTAHNLSSSELHLCRNGKSLSGSRLVVCKQRANAAAPGPGDQRDNQVTIHLVRRCIITVHVIDAESRGLPCVLSFS